jgi:diguanylate cyclase (GGDEF)-like protein
VLVFIDLDGFKSVDDTYGHEAGDRVLQAVARRLLAAVRPLDIVGRYGGDEFVVLCAISESGSDAAGLIADRLAGAMLPPVEWDGGSWRAGASIGLARPEPGDDVRTLVRRADLDMFEAKKRRLQRVD